MYWWSIQWKHYTVQVKNNWYNITTVNNIDILLIDDITSININVKRVGYKYMSSNRSITSVYYMYNTDQHTEYHTISNVLLHKYHEIIIYEGKVWKLTQKINWTILHITIICNSCKPLICIFYIAVNIYVAVNLTFENLS